MASKALQNGGRRTGFIDQKDLALCHVHRRHIPRPPLLSRHDEAQMLGAYMCVRHCFKTGLRLGKAATGGLRCGKASRLVVIRPKDLQPLSSQCRPAYRDPASHEDGHQNITSKGCFADGGQILAPCSSRWHTLSIVAVGTAYLTSFSLSRSFSSGSASEASTAAFAGATAAAAAGSSSS